MLQNEPEIVDLGNGYSVSWTEHHIQILVEYITRQTQGIYAELTVCRGDKTLCEAQRVNLNGDKSRIAKKVHEYDGMTSLPNWTKWIESTCVLVLRRYREGQPVLLINSSTAVEHLKYRINPIAAENKLSIMFGLGGIFKSTLLLLMAMLIATGESIAGLSATRGRVLFVDYEDSWDVAARRMKAISTCHPQLKSADIRYLSHHEPIWNIVPTLLRRIQLDRIDFLVLDSLAAATGGDASAEAATKASRALRMLNIGALVIAHTPKSTEDHHESSIYGSVFFTNFARATWEVRKEQEIGSDSAVIGLFNRKNNLSRMHHPIGIRIQQNPESSAIRFDSYDLSQTAELEKGLPVASRIRNFLERDGSLYTAKEIADAIEAPLATVKVTLSRQNKVKWHSIGEGRDVKWATLCHR